MTPKALAKALKETIDNGLDAGKAVKSFISVLERRGITRILPKVAYELELLEKREDAYKPTISVAKDADLQAAMASAGVADSDVVKNIDETLIGGYKFEQNGTLTDTSYKSGLLDLYRKITNN